MPAPSRPTSSLPLRLARAAGSLLALTALTLGAPWLLLRIGTTPRAVPTWGEVGDALLAPDDGRVLLGALTCVCWLLWAWFVVSLPVEAAALLRHRAAPRIRGLGGPQRLAGLLLGGLLVLPSTTALAATPASAAPATAAAAPATPDQPATAAASAGAPSTAAGPRHVVGPTGETVWDLAERYLGDGMRYQEIRSLNPHLPQAAALPAGTVVQLPADAATTPEEDPGPRPQSAGTAQAADSYTVVPGDTLSAIADQELGDPAAWPEIFAENEGDPQPGGTRFTDPDRIFPGQQLDLPPQAGPGTPDREPPRESAPGPDDKPKTDSPPEDDHASSGADTPGGGEEKQEEKTGAAEDRNDTEPTGPGTSAPPTDQPSNEEDRARDGAPEPPPSPAGTSSPTVASPAPDPAASHDVISGRVAGGIGALLAAGLVGGIALKRILQQRRRAPGETIAMPQETSLLEQALTTTADPTETHLLDTALRTLAHHTGPLPALRGARITTATVQLLPEDSSADPVPPFACGEDGWWTLADRSTLLPADAAREAPAPYPGLVTLGTGADGSLYLVNLPHDRVLLLEGTKEQVRAVCTSIALEAGMSPWADRAEILVTGFGEQLPQLLPTARVRHVPSLAAAVRDLGERLIEAHQDENAPMHSPWMLLCAKEVGPQDAWNLAEAFDAARSLPVAVVAPAPHLRALRPDADILNAGRAGHQPAAALGVDVQLQQVDAAAYQQLVATLAVAEEPSRPATGAWRNVPAEDPSPAPPSPAGAAGEGDDVFPALLDATTGPVTLLPSPTLSDESTPGPGAGHPEPQHVQEPPALEPLPRAATDPTAAVREPTPERGQEENEVDEQAPEIRVLGPLEVTGLGTTGHGPRLAALAALLYFRPGRDAATLCEAMDPANPWSPSTLTSRMHGLRAKLGSDADGHPYVPRRSSGSAPYRLHPAVRCDWDTFQHLATRGLTNGHEGLHDLENALALVRGRPFGSRFLAWAAPLQQEMISRITDVAYTVAHHRRAPGPLQDLDAARQALAVGIECEETAEQLYRGWMLVEHAAGSRSGLHTAITRVQQVTRQYDLDLEPETEQLIADLLADKPRPTRKAVG